MINPAWKKKKIQMITNLVNQIAAEQVIPTEWELSTVLRWYKGKIDALKYGNLGHWNSISNSEHNWKDCQEVNRVTGWHW